MVPGHVAVGWRDSQLGSQELFQWRRRDPRTKRKVEEHAFLAPRWPHERFGARRDWRNGGRQRPERQLRARVELLGDFAGSSYLLHDREGVAPLHDLCDLYVIHYADLVSWYREEPVAVRANHLVVHEREQRSGRTGWIGALADERNPLGLWDQCFGPPLDLLIRLAERGLISSSPLRGQFDLHESVFCPTCCAEKPRRRLARTSLLLFGIRIASRVTPADGLPLTVAA